MKFKIWLRRLIASIQTFLSRKDYKEMHDVAKLMAAAMQKAADAGQIPGELEYYKHPHHDLRLKEYKTQITSFKKSKHKDKEVTIAFGDSILDIPKKDYKSIPEDLNFAISGSWHFHMEQMIVDLKPTLKGVKVKNVVIGTLGGNPLKSYQDYTTTLTYTFEALETVRETFPDARIIVYGLPPVYETYVHKYAPMFEQELYNWVKKDRSAVLIPMEKKFNGAMGFLPKISMSSDGTHLTEKGVVELDIYIEKGKNAFPGSIID